VLVFIENVMRDRFAGQGRALDRDLTKKSLALKGESVRRSS